MIPELISAGYKKPRNTDFVFRGEKGKAQSAVPPALSDRSDDAASRSILCLPVTIIGFSVHSTLYA